MSAEKVPPKLPAELGSWKDEEAALRTAHFFITGRNLEQLEFAPVRGLQGVKEAAITINGSTIRVAVAHGLANVESVLKGVRAAGVSQHDRDRRLRFTHENPEVKRLYDEFLERPLGPKAHALLHTRYTARPLYKR